MQSGVYTSGRHSDRFPSVDTPESSVCATIGGERASVPAGRIARYVCAA